MRALGTLSFASLMMMLSVAGCATASGGNEPDAGGDDVVDARVVDAALDKDGAPVDAAPAVDAQGIDAAAPDAQHASRTAAWLGELFARLGATTNAVTTSVA